MKKHLQVVIFIVSFLFIALYPTEAYISQCHPSRINSMPLKTRKLCMALSFFLENSPQRGKIALTQLIRMIPGAAEPVKNWVRKLPLGKKSGYAKLPFSLLDAQKEGAQLRTLQITL